MKTFKKMLGMLLALMLLVSGLGLTAVFAEGNEIFDIVPILEDDWYDDVLPYIDEIYFGEDTELLAKDPYVWFGPDYPDYPTFETYEDFYAFALEIFCISANFSTMG